MATRLLLNTIRRKVINPRIATCHVYPRYFSMDMKSPEVSADKNAAYMRFVQKQAASEPLNNKDAEAKFDSTKQQAIKTNKTNMYFVLAIVFGSFVATISMIAAVPCAKEMNMCALIFNLLRHNDIVRGHVGKDAEVDYSNARDTLEWYKIEFLDMATFGHAKHDFSKSDVPSLANVNADGKFGFKVSGTNEAGQKTQGVVNIYFVKQRGGAVKRSISQLYEYTQTDLMNNHKKLDDKVLGDYQRYYKDFILLATFTPTDEQGASLATPSVVYSNKTLMKKFSQ